MNCTHFICAPSCPMFLEPSEKSEVTDEQVYGVPVYIKSKRDGFVNAVTDYGYEGYVKSDCICPKRERTDGEKYVVTAPFCDLFSHPDRRFYPRLTLPRGSEIYCKSEEIHGKFMEVLFDEHILFAPKTALKRASELYSYAGEKSKRDQIVKTAFAYTGTPYKWGGKTPHGIDCSGLCFMAYRLCGMALYRDAVPDRRFVRPVSFNELLPADLIYYNGHVTMYIGLGQYIHSSATLGGVTVGSFDENDESYYEILAKDIVSCGRSIAFC